MNEKSEVNIENMIYEINGKEVMLDSDLAKLYNLKTKRINEAVKNNPEKIPIRFSFVLNDNDVQNLRSKISTSNIHNRKYEGRRYNPRVFTEQDIYACNYTKIKNSYRSKYKNNVYLCKNETLY